MSPTGNRLARRERRGGVLLTLFALAALAGVPLAHAADIVVTTETPGIDGGDGACSIIEAIENANADTPAPHQDCAAGSGADTIYPPANGTIVLTGPMLPIFRSVDSTGLPQITSTITIEGNGTTITRVVDDNNTFRILQVAPGGNLTLRHATITGGRMTFQAASAVGGGIFNEGGTLSLVGTPSRGIRRSPVAPASLHRAARRSWTRARSATIKTSGKPLVVSNRTVAR